MDRIMATSHFKRKEGVESQKLLSNLQLPSATKPQELGRHKFGFRRSLA